MSRDVRTSIKRNSVQGERPERRTAFSLFAAAAVLAALLACSIAPPSWAAGEDEIPLMKVEEVTDLIMSPGCNYVYTLTLCPSAEAAQMREIVKDRLIAGESKEDILGYFEQVYGPKVLAQPAKKGFYFVAWWFPYFLLADVIGVVGVVLLIWRKRAKSPENPSEVAESRAPGPSEPETDELDHLVEEEIKRFRDE